MTKLLKSVPRTSEFLLASAILLALALLSWIAPPTVSAQPQLAGNMIRIRVTATVADAPVDRPEPVKDATVRVTYGGGALTGRTNTGTTDQNGVAFVDVPCQLGARYAVEVSTTGGFFSRFETDKRDFLLEENETCREFPFEFKLKLGADKIRVVVHVTRGEPEGRNAIMDTSEPVPGARVLVRVGDAKANLYEEGVTDGSGDATLRVTRVPGTNYFVEVAKEQFQTGSSNFRYGSFEKQTEFPVHVVLARLAGVMATVTVTNEDDGNAVEGASVVFDAPEAQGGYFTGRTDGSGKARVFLTKTGKYDVRVTHDLFEPKSQKHDVDIPRNQAVELDFPLTKKPERERGDFSLIVWVWKKALDARGQKQPISGAAISVPNNARSSTGGEGRTRMSIRGFATGEVVQVTAEAAGYKRQSQTVPVEGKLFGGQPLEKTVNFYLEPGEGEETVSDDVPIQLTVRVVDQVTGSPVPGADVMLIHPNGTPYRPRSVAGMNGEAKATIRDIPELPLAQARSGLSVEARAAGYKDGRSSIPTTMLRPSQEPVNFEMALESTIEPPIKIIMRVTDKDSGNAISGAEVAFIHPNTRMYLPKLVTGPDGKDSINILDFPEAPLAQARAGLSVEARAPGYKDGRSSIPASMLRPSLESVNFEILLESTIMSDLAALEGEVAKLETTKTEILAKLASAEARATEAIREEESIRTTAMSWQSYITQELPSTGQQGFYEAAGLAFCKASLKVAQDLDTTSADRLVQDALNLADEAEAIAKSCATVQDATNIKEKYESAKSKVVALTVRANRTAVQRDRFLQAVSSDERRFAQDIAPLRTSKERATEAARLAAKDMDDVGDKLAELTAGERRVKQQLEGLRARRGLTEAATGKLNGLKSRLDSVNAHGMFISRFDRTARDKANLAAETLQQIEQYFANYSKEACANARTLYTNAVEKYEQNSIAGMLGLESRSNLPARADQCRIQALASASLPVPTVPRPQGAALPPVEAAQAQSPSRAPRSDEVTVPNLAPLNKREDMEAALRGAGLTPAFTPKQPPRKDLENKFAGQSHAPDTKVPRGTTVAFSIYQLAKGLVKVPNLAVFQGTSKVSEMKAALHHVGLYGAFVGRQPPSKDLEFKFIRQTPLAGEMKPLGETVVVSIYQKYDPTAPPDVVGKEWQLGVATLRNKGWEVSGITVIQPSRPDEANTIQSQSPPDERKRIALTRYGDSTARPSGTASTDRAPGGLDSVISGPEREFIGEFKGKMILKESRIVTGPQDVSNKPPTDIKVSIVYTNNGAWIAVLQTGPNAAVGGSGGSATRMEGGVLRYEQNTPGRQEKTIMTIKVNGNNLVGEWSYERLYTDGTRVFFRSEFQATRTS